MRLLLQQNLFLFTAAVCLQKVNSRIHVQTSLLISCFLFQSSHIYYDLSRDLFSQSFPPMFIFKMMCLPYMCSLSKRENFVLKLQNAF